MTQPPGRGFIYWSRWNHGGGTISFCLFFFSWFFWFLVFQVFFVCAGWFGPLSDLPLQLSQVWGGVSLHGYPRMLFGVIRCSDLR